MQTMYHVMAVPSFTNVKLTNSRFGEFENECPFFETRWDTKSCRCHLIPLQNFSHQLGPVRESSPWEGKSQH